MLAAPAGAQPQNGSHGYPVQYAARGARPAVAPRGAPLRWSGIPEANKVVPKIQVAGRPAKVGPAMTAVLAAPTPNKIQPQLQNLPRFQPPDFEGKDGQLPLPDSPCSTPREASEAVSDAPEDMGPFPPMSFVEYKSRSSNQWILAKVESYNADTQSYRLDVQPYAPAERVRARRGAKRMGAQVEDVEVTPVQQASQPVENSKAQEEVELLRRRVAELEEENRRLHAQVAQEIELKERYRQELDARRVQTPR